MADTISTEVSKLLRGYVDGQRFTSINDVILCALQLFGEFEQRYQEQFGKSLQEAFDAIENGEGLVLDTSEDLDTVFHDIMAAGRIRYEAKHSR